MIRVAKLLVLSLLFSSLAMADGRGEHRHHRKHGREHYAPAPQQYGNYDQRTTQGLVGGALGSAVGYEMSKGSPIGAGLGAAAGAWVGNRM